MRQSVVYVSILLLLIFAQNVYAYLDLGTGSYILQLAIGVLLGAMAFIRAYWKKLKTVLRKGPHDDRN